MMPEWQVGDVITDGKKRLRIRGICDEVVFANRIASEPDRPDYPLNRAKAWDEYVRDGFKLESALATAIMGAFGL